MVLAHLLAVSVLAAHLAGVAVAGRRSALAPMAAALACVGAAVSPLAVLNAREAQEGAWIPASTLSTFYHAVGDVGGAHAGKFVLVICGIILTASLAFIPRGGGRSLGVALCLAWGAVPVLLLILVGFLRPLYVPRYTMVALPGIALVEAMAGWRTSVFLATTFRTRQWQAIASSALVGGAASVVGLSFLHTTGRTIQSNYWNFNYRAAAAELSSDLSEHPAPVAVVDNAAGVNFSYYVNPPQLSQAIKSQEMQKYNRYPVGFWGNFAPSYGRSGPPQPSSVVNFPAAAKLDASTIRCPVGWAIGTWSGPSKTLIIDGSSCQVRRVHHYGAVWVVSLRD